MPLWKDVKENTNIASFRFRDARIATQITGINMWSQVSNEDRDIHYDGNSHNDVLLPENGSSIHP